MINKAIALVTFFSLVTINIWAQPAYKEITLPELMKKKQHGDKNIVIVDVRTNGEFHDSSSRSKQSNIGRIKDAVHIELRDLMQDPDAVKKLEPYKDKEIYLICSHSYRSRTASNILLKNGFTNVSNVRGGMTEWYRRYDELAPFAGQFETSTRYKNISPSELLTNLNSQKEVLLIGIRNTPRFWYDSANQKFYQHYPLFKQTVFYNYSDSLKILEEVKKKEGRPVVLFNLVNNGAAELTDWLTAKGVKKASYLVGGPNLFYEWAANTQSPATLEKLMKMQSRLRFLSPPNFCKVSTNENLQMIDVRHDTIFNKMNDGTVQAFKHLKYASGFFHGNGVNAFEQTFADKKKEYVLISGNGLEGLEFANELAEKGYTIHWITGGLDRWEWYMNNVEDFKCYDSLVK